jgi:hypothetical protein
VLAEYHPRGLWHHFTRKATRVLRRIEPEAHALADAPAITRSKAL